MKAIQFLIFASLFSSFLFLNSCASISGFHTGRTVEQGRGEVSMALNVARSPNFLDSVGVDVLEDIPIDFVPNFEVGIRYGIAEKFDMGFRLNTASNFLIDAKYQLIGDQESEFALSVGAGFGGFGLGLLAGGFTIYNFQLPLYLSYHPTEQVHIYASPRYVGQFPTAFVEYTGFLNYSGFNTGFMYGKDIKFGVDFGYYNVTNNNRLTSFKNNVYNIGVGLILKL